MPPTKLPKRPQKFRRSTYIDIPDRRNPMSVTIFNEIIREGVIKFTTPVRI